MARPKRTSEEESTPSTAASTPVATAAVSLEDVLAMNRQLMEQNQSLMAALMASRESGKATTTDAANEEQVRVVNLLGVTVAFQVADVRTGIPRSIVLDQRGSFTTVQRGQLREMQEKYPHFFEQGYLGCPEVPSTPNTIENFDRFLSDLPEDQIVTRINSLTSSALLFDLFNHIENQRFTHLDEKGNVLVERDGDKPMLVMKERQIPFKLQAIERAIQQRIADVTGVKIALDI
jgi:hypothetical protein